MREQLPLLHRMMCFEMPEKGFMPEALLRFKLLGWKLPLSFIKPHYLKGSRFSQCFLLSTTLQCSLPSHFLRATTCRVITKGIPAFKPKPIASQSIHNSLHTPNVHSIGLDIWNSIRCSSLAEHCRNNNYLTTFHRSLTSSLELLLVQFMCPWNHSPKNEQSVLLETSRPHWLFSELTAPQNYYL